MKTTEIKDLSLAELKERIITEKDNLQKIKLTHTVSPLENASVLSKARRDIARMLTVLQQKQNQL